MKYFCISDIHGCYDQMIAALKDAGFDKENDTLISVGDLFDRGPKSKEVLEFVMSCPHRLLCMGNHDLRLMQLIGNPYDYNQYDYGNGVLNTLASFIGAEVITEQHLSTWDGLLRLRDYQLLKDYFHECHAAFEFSNLIITHAWLPVNQLTFGRYESFHALQPDGTWGDWHKARGYDWEEALWSNTERMINNKVYPNKPLLIGHWHAWRLAEKFGEKRQTNKHDPKEYINCKSFEYTYQGVKKWIAIDGCTNWPYGGCVNVYQFESDETPDIIPGGLGRWYY